MTADNGDVRTVLSSIRHSQKANPQTNFEKYKSRTNHKKFSPSNKSNPSTAQEVKGSKQCRIIQLQMPTRRLTMGQAAPENDGKHLDNPYEPRVQPRA